jgi:hypothetical protein
MLSERLSASLLISAIHTSSSVGDYIPTESGQH